MTIAGERKLIKVKLLGVLLLASAMAIILAMSYALIAPLDIAVLIIKVVLWVVSISIGLIIAWIGYTLLTIKEPKPVEELKKEIEAEIEQVKREAIDAAMSLNEGNE